MRPRPRPVAVPSELLQSISDQLRDIRDRLRRIETKENLLMATVDDVDSALTQLEGVENTVVELLDQLRADVDAAATDPARLDAAKNRIDALSTALQDAVNRDDGDPNTPPPTP